MLNKVQQQATQAYTIVNQTNQNGKPLPQPATSTATPYSTSDTVTLNSSSKVASIANQYDVRNMSPREMSQMSQSLYEQGNISFEEHALLSFQPELLDPALNGKYASPDQPKDFIAHWEEKLAFHQQRGETEFAKKDKNILNILKNLHALTS